jgi:hypothetical protein
MDELPPWWLPSLVRLFRQCQRPILWARVAVLYAAGELFACRRCYDLAYMSQQEYPVARKIRCLQKIRMRLGGSADVSEPFPEKPRGTHRRTYLRLRERAEAAEAIVFGRAAVCGTAHTRTCEA